MQKSEILITRSRIATNWTTIFWFVVNIFI